MTVYKIESFHHDTKNNNFFHVDYFLFMERVKTSTNRWFFTAKDTRFTNAVDCINSEKPWHIYLNTYEFDRAALAHFNANVSAYQPEYIKLQYCRIVKLDI